MKTNFRYECECCQKGYNFGNPYYCDDCISPDYYDYEDISEDPNDYASISDLFKDRI